MPARHATYPYVEPIAVELPTDTIEATAEDFAERYGYRSGHSLEDLCRAAGVDTEYSHHPNEILLDLPLEGRPVIWLPRDGRKREDRVAIATALGYWALHVPGTRNANPGCGVQALYDPTSTIAAQEAENFGLALLMPQTAFRAAWYEGRAQTAAALFDVPTKTVYLRAERLLLKNAS